MDDLTRDDLVALVADALAAQDDADDTGLTTTTYAEAGVMTADAGLVVRTADGAEYQLTVVRSR